MASKLRSFLSLSSFIAVGVLATAAVPACSAESAADKAEPTDEATSAFGLGDTRISGSLVYGETSALTQHGGSPRYRAFKFAGNAGDEVDVWVRSNNGDPVTWILDNDWRMVAMNDDASRTNTNSHVTAKLPANPSATHYVVVRDYWRDPMGFRVELKGTPGDFVSGCNVDADCAKIDKACCANMGKTAVLASKAGAYTASLGCVQPVACTRVLTRPDYSAPQCNRATKKCELVQPKDITCGGFVPPGLEHKCPDGYSCKVSGAGLVDAPGKCVQFCGGFGGFQCHDPNHDCVDDPTDSCDPNNGGADCGGICVTR